MATRPEGSRKRPRAVDFWDYPQDYNGLREDETALGNIQRRKVGSEHIEPLQRPNVIHERIQDRDNGKNENENLNPTCVTPFVARLAEAYYRELLVAGQPLKPSVDGFCEKNYTKTPGYVNYLNSLLWKTREPPQRLTYDKADAYPLARRSMFSFYRRVFIGQLLIEVGDTVILPIGTEGDKEPQPLPELVQENSRTYLGDLFWFAKILCIRRENSTAHVQWFHHSRNTILEEIGHPQELFLSKYCDDIDTKSIVGKCHLMQLEPGVRPQSLRVDEFFYSLSYDQVDGSFQVLDSLPKYECTEVGDCPFCTLRKSRENPRSSCEDEKGVTIGFTVFGSSFHVWDFALITKLDGSSAIAQIIALRQTGKARDLEKPFYLEVQVFGRYIDLMRGNPDFIASSFDDRRLYRTDQILRITSAEVFAKCFVLHKKALDSVRKWLILSPNHFYVQDSYNGQQLQEIPCRDIILCKLCIEQEAKNVDSLLAFKRHQAPLRALDPFCGSGALVLGLQQVTDIQFAYAFDNSPNAAETVRKNSPGTIVYNQCSNKLLDYTVSYDSNVSTELRNLASDQLLPPPPKKGDVDLIVSGFPCQPHSKLNMFQKAHDLRNELLLNFLSWVDWYRPIHCLAENVPGFVETPLKGKQVNQHKVRGGIEKGCLKLLIRILTSMGYQTRVAILQAGNYGAPQSRERFFCWASLPGNPLPEFPQATHAFPVSERTGIRFPKGSIIAPRDLQQGIYAFPHVNIEDAISDLKRWDWENPHKIYPHNDPPGPTGHIQIACSKDKASCGPGRAAQYEHEPRSPFQAKCRARPSRDLQHITACLRPEVVERVIYIELKPRSDYMSANSRPLLWEYQTMNASSANARQGYKRGWYGRLGPKDYFRTTVTNVGPTAKQSWVLNPWCRRIYSVRELARSQGFPDDFRFYSMYGRVNAIHTQIGNAVPWPQSEALGRELLKVLHKKWKDEKENERLDGDVEME